MMRIWTVRLLAGAAFALLATGTATADTAPSCKDAGFHWTTGEPSINLRHVLCGEVKKNGDVVGLHSRALADTAPVTRIEPQAVQPDGIYGAQVTFENGKTKFSTFFPDHCGIDQVTTSILYAVKNSFGPARPWGKLGCSAPDGSDPAYCRGPQGQRFVIRFGELKDGRVNTAFPQTGETCR